MRVSLHVFVYNFFISEVKTGWVMTGQVSACPNISGWNVFGPKHIFGAKFLLNDFFFNQILLSHPFTFNCSSFNIATLGLYLRFSGWLKIWNVPVCKPPIMAKLGFSPLSISDTVSLTIGHFLTKLNNSEQKFSQIPGNSVDF